MYLYRFFKDNETIFQIVFNIGVLYNVLNIILTEKDMEINIEPFYCLTPFYCFRVSYVFSVCEVFIVLIHTDVFSELSERSIALELVSTKTKRIILYVQMLLLYTGCFKNGFYKRFLYTSFLYSVNILRRTIKIPFVPIDFSVLRH